MRRTLFLLSLICLFPGALACGRDAPVPAPGEAGKAPVAPADPAAEVGLVDAALPMAREDIRVDRIAPGETLAGALFRLELSGDQVSELTNALRGHFDFTKSRPGDQIRLTLSDGEVQVMEYRASMTREWLVTREPSGLRARQREIGVEREVALIELTVGSTLYDSMRSVGEDPGLAIDVAEVFAWDIDFYRDVRRGDRLRLVVEKERVQGKLLRYGEILGARYDGALVGDKTYLRYEFEGGGVSYFDEKGQSAKKAFLKSPLKYAHVTSNFGGRNHPVLGYYKNHQGVDLRAAVGTPVWSVADGTVTRAVKGDRVAGTYLFVRHANGIETTYLHLSKLAPGIQAGVRVKQKQIIAYSGNTGRSTGPHLHYGMRRSGQYVNPFSQKFPRGDPLPKGDWARFQSATADTRRALRFEGEPDAEKRAEST